MHPAYRLLVIVAILILGMAATAVLMGLLAMASGMEIATFREILLTGEGDLSPGMLRNMLLAQAIGSFLFPGFLFCWMFYRLDWREYLRLHRPHWVAVVVGVLALAVAYPLVQLAFDVNSLIPLPSWMSQMEDDTAAMLGEVLRMDGPMDFLATLIVVALLPGIGEELVFRGLIQNQLSIWTKHPAVAVWLTAIIFSTVHGQFEGFLPRIALGAVLGFVYVWTRNLWVPMIVHAINNGFQVCVLYFSGVDLSAMESEESMDLNLLIILGSVGALYLCHRLLVKYRSSDV